MTRRGHTVVCPPVLPRVFRSLSRTPYFRMGGDETEGPNSVPSYTHFLPCDQEFPSSMPDSVSEVQSLRDRHVRWEGLRTGRYGLWSH